jgi:hypothetical protein
MNRKKWFIWENPEVSAMWRTKELDALAAVEGVPDGTLDQCCYGLKDPLSRMPMKKPMTLLHSFPEGVLDPVFKRCKKNHQHQKVEGWCKGYGRRSTLSQVYPVAFCNVLANCIADFLEQPSAPAGLASDRALLVDLLDDDHNTV